MMKEAMLYEKLKDKMVKCNLCNHRCIIADGKFGICHVRQNKDGKLFTLVYGKAIASHIDPIEKKPLFHFLPGTKSFSISTVGCNFRCLFCQNFDISQSPKLNNRILGEDLPPEEVVKLAKQNGCKSIAYTYTEPTIFFEYAYDIAKLAKKTGLKNVFVSNGYYTEETLKKIKPYLDAVNIDLKSSDEKFYLEIVGAKLKPVLNSIKKTYEADIWVEVTTLIIPGHNDSDKNLKNIAEFLVSINKNIPWHISRFFPMYKMSDVQLTPVETLHRAYEIGKSAGLNYVYVGNVPGNHENTICPECGEMVISRYGYSIRSKLENGKCPKCKTKLPFTLN